MSILSNSNYDQMAQTINRLKQAINQQSSQELQKYEIISIKVKIIEEQILESQLALQKYQKDCHLKVDKFANETKQKFKLIQNNTQDHQISNDLAKELRQLQSCRNKLIKLNENRNELIAQRLQRQIDLIKQNLSNKTEQDKKRLSQTEQAFNKEVKSIRLKLQKLKQDDSQSTILQIEQLKQSNNKQMNGLRAKRKQKKQKFLQLLETIIVKCKESSQNNV